MTIRERVIKALTNHPIIRNLLWLAFGALVGWNMPWLFTLGLCVGLLIATLWVLLWM